MAKNKAEDVAQCLLDFTDNFGENGTPDEFQALINDFFTKPADSELDDESDWDEEEEEIGDRSDNVNENEPPDYPPVVPMDEGDRTSGDNDEDVLQIELEVEVEQQQQQQHPNEVNEPDFVEGERVKVREFRCKCKLDDGNPCYALLTEDQYLTSRLDMMALGQGGYKFYCSTFTEFLFA